MLVDPGYLNVGVAALCLVVLSALGLRLAVGNRSLKSLTDIRPEEMVLESPPKVSILIPARNEALHIEEALTSLLNLDYPDYELIVLNDRSTDETGDILDRMSRTYQELNVVHIESLPPDWLGKNHALFVGAEKAQGELLLFTDADIVFEPTALGRAVRVMESESLDHFCLLPGIQTRTLPLKLFISTFTIFFSLFAEPWNVRKKNHKAHIGIGAFNLIRKTVYQQIGTHQAIAMRPDDDLKLGKLVKKNGFTQDIRFGAGMIEVEWYPSLPAMIEGLMKNAFAGVDYRLWNILTGCMLHALFFIWPFFGFLVSEGLVQVLYGLCLLVMFLISWDNARFTRLSKWSGLFFPLISCIMLYIMARSTWLTYRNNGINWRGTHYPLDKLKASRI